MGQSRLACSVLLVHPLPTVFSFKRPQVAIPSQYPIFRVPSSSFSFRNGASTCTATAAASLASFLNNRLFPSLSSISKDLVVIGSATNNTTASCWASGPANNRNSAETLKVADSKETATAPGTHGTSKSCPPRSPVFPTYAGLKDRRVCIHAQTAIHNRGL
jgi:hypothetical protein